FNAAKPIFPVRFGCIPVSYISEGRKWLLNDEKPTKTKTRKGNPIMNKTKIKHHLRRIFSVLAVIGALFALPGATADTQSNGQGAHGSWTDCEHITNVTDYGSYSVVEYEITTTYTGTFDGTWEGTEEDVFYPDGYVTVDAEGTFSGSVAGTSGTVR